MASGIRGINESGGLIDNQVGKKQIIRSYVPTSTNKAMQLRQACQLVTQDDWLSLVNLHAISNRQAGSKLRKQKCVAFSVKIVALALINFSLQ